MSRWIAALAAVMAFAGQAALADSLKMDASDPSQEEFGLLRQSIEPLIWAMRGVVSTNPTACDVRSGAAFTQMSEAQRTTTTFASCLVVGFDNQVSRAAFEALIPSGTRLNGVIIRSDLTAK